MSQQEQDKKFYETRQEEQKQFEEQLAAAEEMELFDAWIDANLEEQQQLDEQEEEDYLERQAEMDREEQLATMEPKPANEQINNPKETPNELFLFGTPLQLDYVHDLFQIFARAFAAHSGDFKVKRDKQQLHIAFPEPHLKDTFTQFLHLVQNNKPDEIQVLFQTLAKTHKHAPQHIDMGPIQKYLGLSLMHAVPAHENNSEHRYRSPADRLYKPFRHDPY